MKKAAKKKTKTYFTPLFKVNGYKSDDVQKQSQLTVDTHKFAHNETNSISAKDTTHSNSTINDPFIIVQSFMDDNTSNSYIKNSSTVNVKTTTTTTNNNNNNNYNHNHNHNSANNSIKSSSSPNKKLNIEITTVQSFINKENNSCDQNSVAAIPMNQSHSNGFTNIFKKSIKKSHDLTHETINCHHNFDSSHSANNNTKKTNSFKKFYNKTKSKRKSSIEEDNVFNVTKKVDNFINYTTEKQTASIVPMSSTSQSIEFKSSSFGNKSVAATRPQQTPSYFGTSSSSYYLHDDSNLNNNTQNSTITPFGTPLGTPLGTQYETFEDILSTPNPNDDLEVCSINTSSTKRFKTMRRSNLIMSLNSTASVQLTTPNSTTSQFFNTINNTNSFTTVPVSPVISSTSNTPTPNNFNNNMNNQSRIFTTTNSSSSRNRMKSVSSNISSNQNYYQHPSSSSSSSNNNIPLLLNSSPSVKKKPVTPTLQLQTSRSRSSSGHLTNLRSSTPLGVQSNNKIGLDTVLIMMEKQHQQQRQINSQPHTPQHISQPPYTPQYTSQSIFLPAQQSSPSSKQPIPAPLYNTHIMDNRLHQVVLEQERQILNQKLHHNDPQILENLLHEFVNLLSDVDIGELGIEVENIEKNDIAKNVDFQLDDSGLEQTELLPKELDDLINIIRLEDLSKEFGL